MMGFVQSPTYFLAPNWDFKPGGKIALGNIISNPLKPHFPCFKIEPDKTPEVDVSIQNDWQFNTETGLNMSLGVWATFLEFIRQGANVGSERTTTREFSASSLHTITLRDDPSQEEIVALCNNPAVRSFMDPASTRRKPVYMITGLKIAKDFHLGGGERLTYNIGGESGADVLPGQVSFGVETGLSKINGWNTSFSADDDIIFAYQLLKIKPKGWFKGIEYEAKDFHHKGHALSDEDAVQEDVEVEKDFVTEWDLEDLGPKVEAKRVDDAWVGVPAQRPTATTSA